MKRRNGASGTHVSVLFKTELAAISELERLVRLERDTDLLKKALESIR
jgi:ribosomal protein S6